MLGFRSVASVLGKDEAAPDADRGKRGLGLPLPYEAGTGPVAEVSYPGQPRWVYPSSPGDNRARQQHNAWRVEWMRACRKLPAIRSSVFLGQTHRRASPDR
jgi:hypothetical protein